jgi:hypothetical protein
MKMFSNWGEKMAYEPIELAKWESQPMEDILNYFPEDIEHRAAEIIWNGVNKKIRPKVRGAIVYLMEHPEIRKQILTDFNDENTFVEYSNYEKYIENLKKILERDRNNLPELLKTALEEISEFTNSDEFKELSHLVSEYEKPVTLEMSTTFRMDPPTFHEVGISPYIGEKYDFSTEYCPNTERTTEGIEGKIDIYEIYSKVESHFKKIDPRGYIDVFMVFNTLENKLKVHATQYVPRSKLMSKLTKEPYKKASEVEFEMEAPKTMKELAEKFRNRDFSREIEFQPCCEVATPDSESGLIYDLKYIAASAETISSWNNKDGKIQIPEEYNPIKENLVAAGWPLE